MTPQLWTRFLTFQEWQLTHPDLTNEEAAFLYRAELQLFQNYQDEIRNQTINRQTQLTGDLLNLSADISAILSEGGSYWLAGYYNGIIRFGDESGISHFGSFFGDTTHVYATGDIFKVDSASLDDLNDNGFYKVLIGITLDQRNNIGLANVDLLNKVTSGNFVKIANIDGTAV